MAVSLEREVERIPNFPAFARFLCHKIETSHLPFKQISEWRNEFTPDAGIVIREFVSHSVEIWNDFSSDEEIITFYEGITAVSDIIQNDVFLRQKQKGYMEK